MSAACWTPAEAINGVLVGNDNFLFLADGGHHVLDFATGQRHPDASSIANFRANIASRRGVATSVGARYLHVIVPDKQSVLADKLPFPIKLRLGELCAAGFPDNCVYYPRKLLESLSDPPYYRTDTHLTHGATIRLATRITELCTGEQLTDSCDELLRSLTPIDDFVGDLGSKMQPILSESILRFTGSWPARWLHNGSFGGNNGIVDLRFSGNRKFTKRVALFGDSFGRELAWVLSYFFEEVFFFRTPFVHEEMVTQLHPAILISQCAERYLESCLPDDSRPCFLLYPFFAGHKYEPSIDFSEALSAVLSYPREPYWAFRRKLQLKQG